MRPATVASLVAGGLLVRGVAPDETIVTEELECARFLRLETRVARSGVVVLAYAASATQSALIAAAAHGGLTVVAADGVPEVDRDAALVVAAGAALPGLVEPALAALAELRAMWASSLVPPVGQVDSARARELATLAVTTVETALLASPSPSTPA